VTAQNICGSQATEQLLKSSPGKLGSGHDDPTVGLDEVPMSHGQAEAMNLSKIYQHTVSRHQLASCENMV
jgi:hypothetical protein